MVVHRGEAGRHRVGRSRCPFGEGAQCSRSASATGLETAGASPIACRPLTTTSGRAACAICAFARVLIGVECADTTTLWIALPVRFEAGSPESDTTSCLGYVLVLDESDRQELVEPYLVWNRTQVDINEPPSTKLVERFADDIRKICAVVDDEDEEKYTAGFVANYVFKQYQSKYSA